MFAFNLFTSCTFHVYTPWELSQIKEKEKKTLGNYINFFANEKRSRAFLKLE